MSQTKAQLISDLVQALNFTGTASAPANGLFLSATNTLQLSTASTPRLTINSDGHVDVVGNLDVGAGIDVIGDITSTGRVTAADLTIQRSSGNLSALFVADSGLGTLEIGGSTGAFIDLKRPNSDDFDLRVETQGTGGVITSASGLTLATAVGSSVVVNRNLDVNDGLDVTGSITGTADLTIDTNTLHVDSSNNRVGIGTTSPGAPLHINMGAGGLPKIRLEHAGAGNDVFEITSGLAGISNSGFGIYDVGETAYRFVIDTNGKIGIGQTNPGAFDKFVVQGTGTVISAQASSGAVGIGFFEANTGRFFLKSLNGGDGLAFIDGDNSSVRLSITADGDVTFGTQSGGSSPTNSSQIRHFDFGVDHWSGTAGDYRALRLKVYNVSNDDVYGIGISSNLLEIQSQQNIGFFAGTAGGGTGRRVERARITTSELEVKNSTKLRINNAIAPESHAQLNIGSTGSSETRAIDIDGNWGNGEHKSISFTHGTSTADIVGQINCVHNSPDSSLRFGRLYHGGNSSAFTMTLDSTSTSGANLTLHDGNLILASGHGISFAATNDASGAASELLDDYEEGTFTPAVTSGLSAGQISYNSRSAKYTKVGNTVYFTFHININSATLDSGALKFGGLPFTAANVSHTAGGAWKIFTNGNIDANATYKVVGNATDVAVITSAGDAMAANATSIDAGHRHMAYWGFYFV